MDWTAIEATLARHRAAHREWQRLLGDAWTTRVNSTPAGGGLPFDRMLAEHQALVADARRQFDPWAASFEFFATLCDADLDASADDRARCRDLFPRKKRCRVAPAGLRAPFRPTAP